MFVTRFATTALIVAMLSACTANAPAATSAPTVAATTPTAAPTATPTVAPSPTPAASPTVNPLAVPAIPAPVAVSLDAKTTVLAVLDIFNPTCAGRPQCVESLPAVAALLKKARDAKVPVIYTSTAATNTFPEQIAPQPGEPVILPSIAAKFDNPAFEDALKQRQAKTILMVGTRSSGAVLYTAFEANARGYTVAVAVDGISGSIPFENNLTMWQLLNQPGFTNADNKPLAEKLVTLTKGDLVTFK